MVGVLFFFEDNDTDVFSGRPVDLGAWNLAFKMAGDVDRVVVVNITDQSLATLDADVPQIEVGALPELEGRVAYLCPPSQAGVSLWQFGHAVDWYAFGPANGWKPPPTEGRVTVPSATGVALHAVHTASIVMAHRFEVVGGR